MPKGVYIRKPKTSKYAVGTVHDTPSGKIKIVEYLKAKIGKRHRAVIMFLETGYVANVQCSNIAAGKIKDYRKRTVYGVGYLGAQLHIPPRDSKTVLRRLYDLWANMLKRVYGGYDTGYSDVTVDPRWHSFESFMSTIIEVPGYMRWERNGDVVLDKDIRISGSRTYSRDTCLFVTPFENSSSDASKRRWASNNE